ncbi:hypothetical protein HBA55_04870 [Pseudomaricurvus alkylphenolicus]|uniref:VOC family protein n=1 Tax=Pseudomaricurvus alkylphenolicus TaxID=1306991 RepID=UPI0014229B0E|nr:VOC family protein [Pseudomaricurvus alkylphenolicus]NIB38906.1 hypothetical protein [Pseudomaricurvus alkylphenolicus]
MTSNIRGLHHVALVIPDLDQAIEFYGEALGFELVKRASWEAPHPLFDNLVGLKDCAAEFCLLKTGNCYLEMFCYQSSRHQDAHTPAADQPGIRHLAFEIEELQPSLEKVLQQGGSRIGEVVHVKGGGSAVYCRDPFGNILELVQPAGNMPGLN